MRTGTAGRDFEMEDSTIHAAIFQLIVWCGVSQLERQLEYEWEMGRQKGVRAEGKVIKCFKIAVDESILLLQLSHMWWVKLSCLFKGAYGHSSAEEIQAFELCMGRTCKSWNQQWGNPTRSSIKLWRHCSAALTKLSGKHYRSVENMSTVYSQSCSQGRTRKAAARKLDQHLCVCLCNGKCSDLFSVCVQFL